MEGPIKEGFLLKKKTKGMKLLRPKWQKRYFVAHMDSKILTYTKSEDGKALGRIDAADIVSVERCKSIPGGLHFQLELSADARNGNGGRVFYLQAEYPQEADEWIVAIQRLCGDGELTVNTAPDTSGQSTRRNGDPKKASPKIHSPPGFSINGKPYSTLTKFDGIAVGAESDGGPDGAIKNEIGCGGCFQVFRTVKLKQ